MPVEHQIHEDGSRTSCYLSMSLLLSFNLLNEVGSIFWHFEVRVQYRRKKVHVRYLIS